MENESKYLHLRPPKQIVMAAGLLLVILSVFFIVKIKNEYYAYNRTVPAPTITVSGEGKILVKPDVAAINVGVVKQSMDVGTAQKAAAEVINKLNDFLGKNGVEEKDIKTTSYNISPRYDYKEGTQIFRGYEVHQNLEVKIRDLSKVGTILSGSAALGANQVGSLQFTIDDPKKAKAEARELAIREAREKAVILSKDLGVRLKKLYGYSESGDFYPPMPIYGKAEYLGVGGDTIAPSVPAGENEIKIIVNLTYEIK